MSILIIGDDLNNEIRNLYRTCGAYRTKCWKSCECLEMLPEDIDALVLLPDECNHNLIGEYKRKATKQGIPYVCVRNTKRAKSEFAKLTNEWHQQWLSKVFK